MQFVLTNPPARRVGSGGSKMAKGKQIVKAFAARGGRKFMGLSVPVFETGASTAAGVFASNVVAAKVAQYAGVAFLGTWYGKAIVKVASGILLKMLVGKVYPKGANAVLGGAIASAVLTAARNFLPANSSILQGLGGDVVSDYTAGFAGYGTDPAGLGQGFDDLAEAVEAGLSGGEGDDSW